MKYLKIQNKGELDIRLVALMGGTTKHNKFKIGQFGTGLKYTLAYLFRNNIDFRIFSGENKVDVTTENELIQNEDFEIICINGHRTSITTRMGHQWTAWMIIRELWCNALDEGEEVKAIVTDTELEGAAGATTFYIQLTPEIQEVFDNWGNYFIQDLEPISDNENYAIYRNPNEEEGKLRLYKNGVLIYQHPDIVSLFYYDIKGADINELREFRGSVNLEVMSALANPSQEAISYFFNHVKEKHYEGSEFDFSWYITFGNIWKEALGGRKVGFTGSRGYYEGQGVEVDFTNVLELPKKIYEAITKQFEGVGVVAKTDDDVEFYETQNAETKILVEAALEDLKTMGYLLHPEAVLKFGIFGDKNKYASSSRKKKTIMLSEICKNLPGEQLVQLLIENNEYITIKAKKGTEEFYKHFITMYTKLLISRG